MTHWTKSASSWFKLLKKKKTKERQKDKHLFNPNISAKNSCTYSDIPDVPTLPMNITHNSSTKPDEVITDEFDLFVQISNSPASTDYSRKCSISGPKVAIINERPIKPECYGFYNVTRASISGQGYENLTTAIPSVQENMEQYFIQIPERKPSTPQPTSFRRDLARASFRSKSVRERGATKKLHSSKRELDQMDYTNVNEQNNYLANEDLCRVRSFKVTSKGVINLGDSIQSKSITGLPYASETHYDRKLSSVSPDEKLAIMSQASNRKHSYSTLIGDRSRLNSLQQDATIPRYLDVNNISDTTQTKRNSIIPDEQTVRIQIVGACNVGKTSLCRQLITSDFLGAKMESISEDTTERHVMVELDRHTWHILLIDNFGEVGAEECDSLGSITRRRGLVLQPLSDKSGDSTSEVNLERLSYSKITDGNILPNVSAYLLVYAIDDAHSYEYACDVLKSMSFSNETMNDKIMILVANKSDLVRRRAISADKGKRVAHFYNIKYFEVSTAINHFVDELLVEIILQVKNKQGLDAGCTKLTKPTKRVSSFKSSGEAIVRYLFRKQILFKSCESVNRI